jgi:small subunit ribosomal protein S6
MINYEINFLILQSETEQADKIREAVKKLIAKYNGKITDELIYQKRKLAYEIKHERYGFYTVYRFDLETGEVLKDLTKDLNLLNGVARHIIVRSDEIPPLQKEIGKDSTAEQGKEDEGKKKITDKKEGKKVLAEIDKETKKQKEDKVASKDTVNEDELEKDAKKETDTQDVEDSKKISDQEESSKATKKTEEKAEKTTTEETAEQAELKDKEVPAEKTADKSSKTSSKKEEISIEDLDKKLDEILDI